MSISVVVPVWNGRDLLARLLDSLDRQIDPIGEILVVDNGSSDGAPEFAADRGARVLPMGHNAGFAPAVNRGIRESRGEWIAVLNSDVELAPDYLARLRGADGWFATGKILSAGRTGVIDGTFDALCRGGTAWRVGSGRADGALYSAGREIWSAPWTAALFRAELFQRTGLLEESFESYLEDVEFGLRCYRHGLSGRYVPEAIALHKGSATLGRWHPETVRHIARNQLLMVARHFPHRWSWPILVAQGLWGLLALRHGAAWAWWKGIGQGLRLSPAARDTFDPERLNRLLHENEQIIWTAQTSSGLDWYWKWYFRLAGRE